MDKGFDHSGPYYCLSCAIKPYLSILLEGEYMETYFERWELIKGLTIDLTRYVQRN